MAFDGFLIFGCIPSTLLTESISIFGFSTIQSYAWSILTNPYTSTIKDPQCCAHCRDMIKNTPKNHGYNRFILNRGLNVADDNFGGSGVRGKGYSDLFESVDNKKMGRNP